MKQVQEHIDIYVEHVDFPFGFHTYLKTKRTIEFHKNSSSRFASWIEAVFLEEMGFRFGGRCRIESDEPWEPISNRFQNYKLFWKYLNKELFDEQEDAWKLMINNL